MSEPPVDSKPSVEARLAELREKIDATDAAIVELLNRRAGFALEVGEVKREVNAPVFWPEREGQVIARLRALGKGPLGGPAQDQDQGEEREREEGEEARPEGHQLFSGRSSGNSITSRMLGWLVSIITSRSMPMPKPAVGAMPCSRART